ncbi:response regulator transcription factor [Candidatus Chlorohelix sp.]|uniref:response regulator transcription factor n=1 Tax=Candidatus Chlorohelix sp. TaxID=3139201 RepID=UPI003144FA61
MAKILVVDDEQNIAETLKYNLLREGYEVILSGDGRQALEIARCENPNLIILDLMLPGMNGLDVCRNIRQTSAVPILMLTAKEEEVDKILGLELGADDYMTKPFNLRELVARVRAMLRRMEMLESIAVQRASEREALTPAPANNVVQAADSAPQDVLTVGELQINTRQHTVFMGEKLITLKPKEFDLLEFLARHRGQVLTRETLLERVWNYDYSGGTRTVDVHIRWIREKIENDPSKPRYIHTIFGVGYKFDPETINSFGEKAEAKSS